MRGCLLVMLACGFLITVLAFTLVILFNYGGLAFLLYAVVVSCVFGAAANYIWEKRDKDEL